MYSELKFMFPCVQIYRKTLILKVLLILMIPVDLISVIFAPVWVLVLFLVVHIAVVVFWIRTKCQLLDAFIFDLFEDGSVNP